MNLKFMYPNTIQYKNWKGEVSWREVVPFRMEYRFSEWHSKTPEHKVWLVIAFDIKKQADREFLLEDILDVKPHQELDGRN